MAHDEAVISVRVHTIKMELSLMKAQQLPLKLQVWVDARKKHHLSHAHIQMARELGLNPKKFGKMDNQRQEPWKAPLPTFIEMLYYKRFSKSHPDEVKSIEQLYQSQQQKKALKKAKKQAIKFNPCEVNSPATLSDECEPAMQ